MVWGAEAESVETYTAIASVINTLRNILLQVINIGYNYGMQLMEWLKEDPINFIILFTNIYILST